MTLTTEQIEQVIDDCRKGAAMRGLFNKWIVEEMASELLRCRERLAELSAVANREAQPVAYLNKFSGVCMTLEQQPNAADDVAVYSPLYTAPPAPAVPEEAKVGEMPFLGNGEPGYVRGWNACRAAMLNHVGDTNEKAAAKCECSSIDYCENCLRAMLAQPVSSGYKLVPVEATEDMIAAAMNCDDVTFNADETFCVNFGNIYAAMLAAAPEGGN
ncbi:hypothetical protein [Serratia marcescens]|uniref:hypothetical protein n=1 Tax=Serratia marcescens TaxID=615 RepID=UPI001D0227EB|nr:hypothetical protein [Serratia marcescens]